ncbi:hypothetical protein niasHS_015433 [Heterodera schachtii]|uniref:CCHC-type domain-containing protein n=1 Tax=Heterodera schachtii TaxID=97005 RepID=A0ABD2HSM8_HETSC
MGNRQLHQNHHLSHHPLAPFVPIEQNNARIRNVEEKVQNRHAIPIQQLRQRIPVNADAFPAFQFRHGQGFEKCVQWQLPERNPMFFERNNQARVETFPNLPQNRGGAIVDQRQRPNPIFGHSKTDTTVPSNLELNLVLERIPDLTGKEGMDKVRKFFKKFDVYTEGWPEKTRISALQSKVYERAERALEAALSTQPFRYECIRREMLQEMEETDSRNLNTFDELMTGVRRKPNEGIDDLANRISTLVRSAYPGLTSNLSDEYSIKFLIQAMDNPELALNLELVRMPCMTLDHFVSLAARAESTQRAATRYASSSYSRREKTNQEYSNYGKQRFLGNRFPANSDNQPNFTPRSEQLFSSQNWQCYNCGDFGHISRNCQKPKQFQKNWQIARVLDVNGKHLSCLFSVNLPLCRRGLKFPINIIAHVTKAPIGFDLLIGTNGLAKLGFKLYDNLNDEMVELEKFEAKAKAQNFLTVIYRTVIEPRSTKIVEFEIDQNHNDSEILISSVQTDKLHIEPTVGKVKGGRVIAPITNLSMTTVTLEGKHKIG